MALGPLYRPLLDLAREAHIDVDGLLAASGLTEALMLDPGTRLAPDVGRAIASELIDRIGDPEIGLRAAERMRLVESDLLGYLVRHSPSALAAFEQIARYARLVGDTADARVERSPGLVSVTFGLTDGRRLLPEATDYFVGGVYRFIDDLSGGRARPTAVRLNRPRPPRPPTYRRFLDSTVAFDTERAALVYPEACLSAPLREADPRLVTLLEGRADAVMATLPRGDTLLERVRAHIGCHLDGGVYDTGAVAKELRMSERTLRRRLQEAGGSYRAILDDVRRERALILVREAEHSVAAIAQRVGFSDATTFARAFRRWTGAAPHEYSARRTTRASPTERVD